MSALLRCVLYIWKVVLFYLIFIIHVSSFFLQSIHWFLLHLAIDLASLLSQLIHFSQVTSHRDFFPLINPLWTSFNCNSLSRRSLEHHNKQTTWTWAHSMSLTCNLLSSRSLGHHNKQMTWAWSHFMGLTWLPIFG